MKRMLSALIAMLLLSGCAAGQSREASSGGGSGAESVSSSTPPVPEEPPAVNTEDDRMEPQAFQPPAPEELFGSMPGAFTFMNGVGSWETELTLAPDGSFTGLYHDTDMGDMDEDYPHGTEYFCQFSGTFSEPVQVDDYTFSTYIVELTQEGTPGETTCEDGFRYICSEPVGLAGADEVLIYCPNAPVANLPEEFVWWVGVCYPEVHNRDSLGRYGLYNVNEQFGFADYQYREG